jgi:hypothetical protein
MTHSTASSRRARVGRQTLSRVSATLRPAPHKPKKASSWTSRSVLRSIRSTTANARQQLISSQRHREPKPVHPRRNEIGFVHARTLKPHLRHVLEEWD